MLMVTIATAGIEEVAPQISVAVTKSATALPPLSGGGSCTSRRLAGDTAPRLVARANASPTASSFASALVPFAASAATVTAFVATKNSYVRGRSSGLSLQSDVISATVSVIANAVGGAVRRPPFGAAFTFTETNAVPALLVPLSVLVAASLNV